MSGLSLAKATINAPADVVWDVMTDLAAYAEWNPFILRVKRRGGPTPAVGDDILLHVRFGNGWEYDSPERIVGMVAPHVDDDGVTRARLEYEYVNWVHKYNLVRGVRTQTLVQRPGGPTEYKTWENLHGLLAWAIPSATVTGGFTRQTVALKQRAESFIP